MASPTPPIISRGRYVVPTLVNIIGVCLIIVFQKKLIMKLLLIHRMAIEIEKAVWIGWLTWPTNRHQNVSDPDWPRHRHDVAGKGIELPYPSIINRIIVSCQMIRNASRQLTCSILDQMLLTGRRVDHGIVPMTIFLDQQTTLSIPGRAIKLVRRSG